MPTTTAIFLKFFLVPLTAGLILKSHFLNHYTSGQCNSPVVEWGLSNRTLSWRNWFDHRHYSLLGDLHMNMSVTNRVCIPRSTFPILLSYAIWISIVQYYHGQEIRHVVNRLGHVWCVPPRFEYANNCILVITSFILPLLLFSSMTHSRAWHTGLGPATPAMAHHFISM